MSGSNLAPHVSDSDSSELLGDKVACSGVSGHVFQSHPLVYLSFLEGSVTCPYCGKVFVRGSEEDNPNLRPE